MFEHCNNEAAGLEFFIRAIANQWLAVQIKTKLYREEIFIIFFAKRDRVSIDCNNYLQLFSMKRRGYI